MMMKWSWLLLQTANTQEEHKNQETDSFFYKILYIAAGEDYNKGDKTSGSGEIPYRRYTPRALGHESVQFRWRQ